MISTWREFLWATLVLVIAVVLAYIFTLHEVQGEPKDPPSVFVTDPSPFDARLTELDREALDEAYKETRRNLFKTWIADPVKQPDRAIFGAQKARAVYIRVARWIEERPKPP